MDAIISLEIYSDAIGKSGVLEKLTVPVFNLLTALQQCRLLIDLQADDNRRLRGLPACLRLYKKLTTSLIQSDLCIPEITQEVISAVINCHLKLNDKKIMENFVYHVVWRAENKETKIDIIWLEMLLAAAKSSPFAKSSLSDALAKRIKLVEKTCTESPWEENDVWRGEFSKFFLVLLRIERFPALADSTRLSSLAPIYQKMDPNRLRNLVVDLLERGNSFMKRHRATHDVFFKIGNALLQTDSSSFRGGLPIDALTGILDCFADLHGLSLARLFIADICRAEKWNWRGRIELIRTVLSSADIWAKFVAKETMAGFVRNTQTALLRSWIAGLEVAVSSESNASDFRSDVSDCFLFSIREEKAFYSRRPEQNSTLFGSDLFTSLLDKMPVQELARLICQVYQADEVPCLRKIPTALNLYSELCRQFVDKSDASLWSALPGNLLVETAKSLFWLGDVSDFLEKILAAHPVGEPNDVVVKIVESADIRQLSDSLPRVRESLIRLLELRVSAVTEVLDKEAATTWQIPNVSLPEHPVVEEFLRSSDQQMTYANFNCTEKAQQFAIFLSSFRAENGVSLHIQTKGEKYTTICEIVKVACPENNRHSKDLLLSEKTTLEEILVKLGKVQREVTDNENDEDDIVVLPCLKKKKLDFSLIDISD